METGLSHCLQIFPVPDIEATAQYYCSIGFRAVYYTDSIQPHACLYRDNVEIVLTKSCHPSIIPNRTLHGYGYDAYFVATNQRELYEELLGYGVKIVQALNTTDYNNHEFVFEDMDGRWVAIGNKIA